jgi:hypothetical protein
MRLFLILLVCLLAVPSVMQAQTSATPIDTSYADSPGYIDMSDVKKPFFDYDADELMPLQTTTVDLFFNGVYDTSSLKNVAATAGSAKFALQFLGKIWSVQDADGYVPKVTLTGADSAGVLVYRRKVAMINRQWAVSAWVLVDSVGVRCSPDTIAQIAPAENPPSHDSLYAGKHSTGYIQHKYVVFDEGDDAFGETSKTKLDGSPSGTEPRTWNGHILLTWRRDIR